MTASCIRPRSAAEKRRSSSARRRSVTSRRMTVTSSGPERARRASYIRSPDGPGLRYSIRCRASLSNAREITSFRGWTTAPGTNSSIPRPIRSSRAEGGPSFDGTWTSRTRPCRSARTITSGRLRSSAWSRNASSWSWRRATRNWFAAENMTHPARAAAGASSSVLMAAGPTPIWNERDTMTVGMAVASATRRTGSSKSAAAHASGAPTRAR